MKILIIHQKFFQEFSRCANETSTKFIYTHFYTDLNEDQIFVRRIHYTKKRRANFTKKETQRNGQKGRVAAKCSKNFNNFSCNRTFKNNRTSTWKNEIITRVSSAFIKFLLQNYSFTFHMIFICFYSLLKVNFINLYAK